MAPIMCFHHMATKTWPCHPASMIWRFYLARDFQNSIVAAVGDVDLTLGTDEDAMRLVELYLIGRAANTRGALCSTTGHAHDLAGFGNITPDNVILGVGNEHAVAVDAEMLWAVERRQAGVAAVASRALLARAGQGMNAPIG